MEVLVVLVIVGILLTSASAFPYTLARSSVDLANRQVAQTYASEAISALRGIQYDNWILIPNSPYSNPYHIEKNVSGWFLTTGLETIGNYRREIIFSDVLRDSNGEISSTGTVDPNTKRAEVTVYWNSAAGELNTKLSTLISNWRDGYGQEVASGFVSQWKLDENSGNTAYDSIGGNDGLVSETTWVPGISGSGLLFDNIADSVEITSSQTLNITSPYSVEFWAKPIGDGISGSYNAIYKTGSFGFYIGSNSISAGINGNLEISGTLNTGVWNHIVLTYDQTLPTDQLNLYIDGSFASSAIQTDAVVENTNSVFLANGYEGYLDEISLYDFVLDSTTIQTHYNDNVIPANLLSAWNFNESTGTVLYDTVRMFDGTILGATWTTGYEGSSLNFNGIDNYVEQDVQLVTGYPFAISAWINTTTANNQDMVIFSLADNTSANNYIEVVLTSVGFAGVISRNPSSKSAIGSTDLRDGNWHFVTGVFASDTDRRIYVDGLLEASDNSSSAYAPEINRWSIGRLGDSNPDSYFEGVIDLVGFWNSDFTDQEVLDLFNTY